jgi:hypothetical protein
MRLPHWLYEITALCVRQGGYFFILNIRIAINNNAKLIYLYIIATI